MATSMGQACSLVQYAIMDSSSSGVLAVVLPTVLQWSSSNLKCSQLVVVRIRVAKVLVLSSFNLHYTLARDNHMSALQVCQGTVFNLQVMDLTSFGGALRAVTMLCLAVINS